MKPRGQMDSTLPLMPLVGRSFPASAFRPETSPSLLGLWCCLPVGLSPISMLQPLSDHLQASPSTCDLTATCQRGHRAGPLRCLRSVAHSPAHRSAVGTCPCRVSLGCLCTQWGRRALGFPLAPRGLRVSPSWLLHVTSTGGPPAGWVRVGGLPEGLFPGLQESKVEVARPSCGSGLDPAQFSSLAVCWSKSSHRGSPGRLEGLDKGVDPRTPLPTATVQRLLSPPGTAHEIRRIFQEPHFLPK